MSSLLRYEIHEKLGGGGFGTVYRGFDTTLKREVAIKMVKDAQGENLKRLEREVYTGAKLNHPNIVAFYDFWKTEDCGYIVMALVEGDDFGRMQRKGPITPDDLLRVLKGAAAGLDYAHANNVLHRDIKPGNIMVDNEGIAKLTDLGLAKVVGGDPITKSGVLGTFGYVPPERLAGAEETNRGDQYSLARVAHYALEKHLLDDSTKAVLSKALSTDPEQRYDSCSQFVEALAEAIRNWNTPTKPIPIPPLPPPRPALPWFKRREAAVGAAVVVVSAVTAAVMSRLHNAEEARAFPPGSAAAETRVNPIDGLTYVWIPGDTYQIGCSPGDRDCSDAESPRHPVSLSGFWIGRTEVTQEAYERVMKMNPSYYKGAQLPVDSVTRNDALRYCQSVGMRLPTEAEWEYAARGKSVYSRYGNLEEIAWYKDNSGDVTHDVAQKKQNRWGLFDMLGNVSEWTADYVEPYSDAAATNPEGPATSSSKALRGGSAHDEAKDVRVSRRGVLSTDLLNGVRCALP